MGKSYLTCECDMFTSLATDLQKGIPTERNMRAAAPLRVPITWIGGKGTLSISWDWCTDSVNTLRALDSCGIVRERLPSPWTIRFTSFSVWGRRETVACEQYRSHRSTRKPQDQHNLLWRIFVAAHTKCRLTFF